MNIETEIKTETKTEIKTEEIKLGKKVKPVKPIKPVKIKYKKIPTSRGRNFCDDLWSFLVRNRDGNKCVICGETEYIQAHHLLSRRVFSSRWTVDNGISLCPNHHEYSLETSAHTSPWHFEEWVKGNKQDQYKTWVNRRTSINHGEDLNYDKIYLELEEQHKAATGNYFRIERISPYILFINFDKIKSIIDSLPQASSPQENSKKEDNKKISLITEALKDFNVGQTAIKEFLKTNKLIG